MLLAQTERELTVAMLSSVNAHLPQTVTIGQQMEYQASVTTHRQVYMVWHSAPDLKGMVAREELRAHEIHSPDSLSITSIKTDLPGPSCPCGLLLRDDEVLVLGLTSSQEIHSITVLPDARVAQMEGGRRYISDGLYVFQIPSDPQIVSLRFVTIGLESSSWVFTTIGDVPLKEAK
jgi:hypothetical protein